MPLDDRLKLLLKEEVWPHRFTVHPHDRNDETSVPIETDKDDWAEFLDSDDWVMVVPILTKFAKAAFPQYLTAEAWMMNNTPKGLTNKPRRKDRKRKQAHTDVAFHDMAYLQTPEKQFRPICVACPRLIEHVSGHCKVGDEICYESLALSFKNQFEEDLNAPPPSTNVNEPEEEEITHG